MISSEPLFAVFAALFNESSWLNLHKAEMKSQSDSRQKPYQQRIRSPIRLDFIYLLLKRDDFLFSGHFLIGRAVVIGRI